MKNPSAKSRATKAKAKGTYGRIDRSGSGASSVASSSPRKRRRDDGGATAGSAAAGKKPSGKKKAPAQKKSKKSGAKAVPKSKHHAAKSGRNSIKERVAAASAAKAKRSKKAEKNGTKKAKGKGNGGFRGGRRPERYRMDLSFRNEAAYLRRRDVPWHEAEAQERFRDNVGDECGFAPAAAAAAAASATGDNENDVDKGEDDEEDDEFAREDMFRNERFSNGVGAGVVADAKVPRNLRRGGGESGEDSDDSRAEVRRKGKLILPPEPVLARIDAELRSFGAYVKLTPSERRARSAFLEHVSDLAAEELRPADEEEEVRVTSFGSFATQEVCVFASDVDLCLWGAVPGSKVPEHVRFVGDAEDGGCSGSDDDNNDDDDGDDKDEGGEDDCFVLEKKESSREGCPLLTESSLLRTMDAIRSAQSQEKAVASKGDDSNDEEAKEQNELERDCLFFIDRVGEGGVEANAKEVVDLSNTKSDKEVETETSDEAGGTNNASTSAGDFEFALDSHGVKELGGDAEDLEDPPNKLDKSSQPDQLVGKTNVSDREQPEPPQEATLDIQGSDKKNASDEQKNVSNEYSGQSFPKNGNKAGLPLEACKAAKLRELDDSNQQQDGEFEPGTFSALGKSSRGAIEIDDRSSEECEGKEVIVLSDDDDDSADKMSSYYARQGRSNSMPVLGGFDAANARASPIDLCDDNSSSEEEEEEAFMDENVAEPLSSKGTKVDKKMPAKEVLELSLTSNSSRRGLYKMRAKPSFGPTGKIRTYVLSALRSLTRQLRRSSFTHTIECRSKARVPIINCGTRTGFEGDIAVGGHNGVDTSTYADSQVKRFRRYCDCHLPPSFAPIVLLLKVLLAQQGFDKPFTGGLGSFKLYVIVAYHIEMHLENGGKDRPSEILISILFRYGCVERDALASTDLEQLQNKNYILSCAGGNCELTPIFRLSELVGMFGECHKRLFDRMLADNRDISYLSSIIDCYRLREARETSDRRSKFCDNIYRPVARNDPGKISAGRRVGQVFTKNGAQNNNFKRGPKGGIVPRKRPDLHAKHSLRNNRESETIQRGMKNRKNKKKQKRDEALRTFASRHSF
ncbi:hypothetical protein ACHAWF_008597 [Thalassiosira exigua]